MKNKASTHVEQVPMLYMKKCAVLLVVAWLSSGCATLHDGVGWEHNMDEESSSLLEHKH